MKNVVSIGRKVKPNEKQTVKASLQDVQKLLNLDYRIDGDVQFQRGSQASEIWENMTKTSNMLKNPLTGQAYDTTLQQEEEFVRSLMDKEMKLSADFFEICDKIKEYDSLNVFREFDREEMLRESNRVFKEWEISKEMVKQAETFLGNYKLDRLQRLAEVERLYSSETTQDTDDTWWPDLEFMKRVGLEIEELQLSVRVSDYYRLSSVLAHKSKRPLLSNSQFDAIVEGKAVEESVYAVPIKGTVAEVFDFVVTYTDAVAYARSKYQKKD